MCVERLSIELTNRCNKGCSFCYNQSNPSGETCWNTEEVVAFVMDCVEHGTKAVSFGGGEPMLHSGLFGILQALRGSVFRSVTSNGLLLEDEGVFAQFVSAQPDKVHLSIHRPDSKIEVERVISSVNKLEAVGIRSGVNLLVPADKIESAVSAAIRLREAGIDNRRIVYLPQRGTKVPSPKEIARVASGPFQSMSCLDKCGKSERFCSISWDKKVAWCSYTSARNTLNHLTYAGLRSALSRLEIVSCSTVMRHLPTFLPSRETLP